MTRIQHAKTDKPFRPAGAEPLFGFISVLQRLQAKGWVKALQARQGAALEAPVLSFKLGKGRGRKKTYRIYTGRPDGMPTEFFIWAEAAASFVSTSGFSAEDLCPWLQQALKGGQPHD